MTSEVKRSRKRKQPFNYPVRKEKRADYRQEIINDFGLNSSPEVTVIEDEPSKGPSVCDRGSGTAYEAHKSPSELDFHNRKLASYKIPKKSSQANIDLTANHQKRSVTLPSSTATQNDKLRLPPTSSVTSILERAKSISTSISHSTISGPSNSGWGSVMTTSHGGSKRTRPTNPFQSHTHRNSMESSLPALPREKPKLMESGTHPRDSAPPQGVNKVIEVDPSDSIMAWDDTCLGLDSPNASFTNQSPQGRGSPSAGTRGTERAVSLEREEEVLSDSSLDSLPAVNELINSGKKCLPNKISSTRRLSLKAKKNERKSSYDDVMTIDSHSEDEAPPSMNSNKSSPREVIYRVDPANSNVSPTRPTTSRPVPPKRCVLLPNPSQISASNSDLSNLFDNCQTILDVANAHSETTRPSSEPNKMSTHLNVFAKKPTVLLPPKEQSSTDKPLLCLSAPPSLSKEGFTVEVSQSFKEKTSSSKDVGSKKPADSAKSGSVFSRLGRQPLKSSSQTDKKSGTFYGQNNKEFSLTNSLFAEFKKSVRRPASQTSKSAGGVISSFRAKAPLLAKQGPITRGFYYQEEETVTLKVKKLQIGRLEPSVIYTELNRETLCVKLDYQGITGTVKVMLKKCLVWQMHLGGEPHLISVLISGEESKIIAGNLSKKYFLDSDFFNSKSSDVSEQYILLTLEEAPSPQEISTITEILNDRSSPHFQKIAFGPHLSTAQAVKLLKEAAPSKPVRSYGRQLSMSEMKKVLPSRSTPAVPPGQVRRSQRTRKPVNRLASSTTICVEDPRPIQPRPNVKLLTYNVPAGSRVNIEVSTNDVDTLAPGEYLNDKVVDFYLRYMWYEKLTEALRPKIHIFSSFFHTRLKDASRDNKHLNTPERMHNRVKTWTRRVDLFNKEYIILPVCDRAHWFVAFVHKAGEFDPGKEQAIRDELKKKSKKKKSPKKSPKKPSEKSPVVIAETSTEEELTEPEGELTATPTPHASEPQADQMEEEPIVPGALLQSAVTQEESGVESGPVSIAGMDFINVPYEDSPNEDSDAAMAEVSADDKAVTHSEDVTDKQEATEDGDDVIRDGPPSRAGSENSPSEAGVSEVLGEGRVAAESKVSGEGGVAAESKMSGEGGVAAESKVSGEGGVAVESKMSGEGGVAAESKVSGEGGVAVESKMSGEGEVAAESKMSGEGGVAAESKVSEEGGVAAEDKMLAEEVVSSEVVDFDVIKDSSEEEEETQAEDIRPCILVLDSLGVRRTGIVKTIRNYLTVEWKEKRGNGDQEELDFELLPAKYPEIPLQNNSSDCGVFMLQYVESLLQRLEEGLPYPDNVEQWANYNQTKAKRKEIEELITKLSEGQTLPGQTSTEKPES